MSPTITICMATFNGERFIRKQIASILSQIGAADELVIVDDMSGDNTVQIVKSFDDPRIKFFENNRNIGSSQAFNRALSIASNDLVFMSDQDDVWHDDKVAIVKSVFDENDIDLMVHDARVVDVVNARVLNDSLFAVYRSSPGFIRNLISNRHTGCCTIIKRALLARILPVPATRGVQHDAWIGLLSIILRGKRRFVTRALIDYNRHDNNVSSMVRNRPVHQALIDRFFLIMCILKRLIYLVLSGHIRQKSS